MNAAYSDLIRLLVFYKMILKMNNEKRDAVLAVPVQPDHCPAFWKAILSLPSSVKMIPHRVKPFFSRTCCIIWLSL